MDELYAFVDGRSVTNNISGLVDLRKREFEGYNKGLAPPERFLTKGACGIYFLFPQILDDLDLLKEQEVNGNNDYTCTLLPFYRPKLLLIPIS